MRGFNLDSGHSEQKKRGAKSCVHRDWLYVWRSFAQMCQRMKGRKKGAALQW